MYNTLAGEKVHGLQVADELRALTPV